MAVSNRENIRRLLVALLTGTAACAYLVYAPVAYAQAPKGPTVPDDAKLLLAANELVYNKDQQLVTATGGVQINYGGYRMVAQKVQYNQQTGRVLASGNIEMIEPTGNRIYAESLDVTDSFSEGFVNSLRVETPDNTRMAAETGERLPGDLMVLNNGVYTACLPCATRKDGAPLWQVKAERVVQNGQTHTVRLENAKFELFGIPLAFIPVLEIPDNTVKRKSGFLFPTMSMSQKLGFGLGIPYYYVINNHMDATLTTTGYTNQGVLLDAEVRNRFETGDHTLRIAHINQMSPDAFTAGTSDALEEGRTMIASKGDFKINPRWSFGWNVMLQSDNNFARTYDLPGGYSKDTFRNEVYLTGLGKRNYFDLRSFYFDKQDSDKNSTAEKQQAIVYPTLDYEYTAPRPVAGGELSVKTNFVNISRDKFDSYTEGTTNPSTRIRGLQGEYSRLTSEAEWKRTVTMPSGLLLTPLLAARADGMRMDVSSPSAFTSEYSDKDAAARYMLTAGLEARYPVLITTDNTTQVIEPIAQVYARPNEQLAGRLPNEDAQSFVFDATSLFDRDKFSGYDRVEGGTRANVGVRYSGSFTNNINVRGLVGQSFQLAGQNSFASDDLVNAGANSGLEDDVSDYVGMAAIDLPKNVSLSTSVRVDNKSLELNRSDTAVTYNGARFQSSLIYTQIAPQPDYGIVKNNELASVTGNLRINTNWSVFGSATYDINNSSLSRRGAGISYSDECTVFSLGYSDYRDINNEAANDWAITARLSFRTLGDINIGSAELDSAQN